MKRIEFYTTSTDTKERLIYRLIFTNPDDPESYSFFAVPEPTHHECMRVYPTPKGWIITIKGEREEEEYLMPVTINDGFKLICVMHDWACGREYTYVFSPIIGGKITMLKVYFDPHIEVGATGHLDPHKHTGDPLDIDTEDDPIDWGEDEDDRKPIDWGEDEDDRKPIDWGEDEDDRKPIEWR